MQNSRENTKDSTQAISEAEVNNQESEISNQQNAEFDQTHTETSSNAVAERVVKEQEFNEALIKLAVLLYQIDGKITLTEQDYFQDLIDELNWKSGVALSAFVNDAIHQSRVAIDHGSAREFLFSLANGLNIDAARALDVAMDITEVDGERSEEELEMLSLLSNRVLARGLVA